MNPATNASYSGEHHTLAHLAATDLLDLARAAGKTVLASIADEAGAKDVVVGASLAGQDHGRHCFDLTTGFEGCDKLHIVVDPEAPSPLRFTAGLGCYWQTAWMPGALRLWCSTTCVETALVPADPDLRFHVVVEEGRLMVEEGLPFMDVQEREVGFFLADMVVSSLMGRR